MYYYLNKATDILIKKTKTFFILFKNNEQMIFVILASISVTCDLLKMYFIMN